MDQIIKTVTVFGRKLGIDLWIVAQSAINVSRVVLDNASTIIRFRTGGISDKLMDEVLSLTEKEKEILGSLPKGFCVVLRKMVHNKPVLVNVPLFDIPDLNDEERNILMADKVKEMREKYLTVIEDKSESVSGESELTADQIHILKDYAISPYESISDKARKLGYSNPTLTRHLKELEEQGFITSVNVNLGKGIGTIKLYKFTDKAIVKVGKQNLVGRGSLGHGFYMHLVKRYYQHNGIQN